MNILKAIFGFGSSINKDGKADKAEKDFEVVKYDGVRAMRSGKPDYAIKCFTYALGMKDDLEVRDYLSQVYISSHHLSEAMEQLSTIAAARPDNVKVYLRMANVAYMMEDYDAMAEAASKAMAVDGDNTTAICLYARAERGRGDNEKAIGILTKAIEIDGNCADARLQRGECFLAAGNCKGAMDDADTLLKSHSDSEDVLLLKAKAELAAGDKAAAVEWYGKVISVNPFSLPAYKGRGALLRDMGKDDEAEEDLSKVVEFEHQNTTIASAGQASEGIEDKLSRQYKSQNPYGF